MTPPFMRTTRSYCCSRPPALFGTTFSGSKQANGDEIFRVPEGGDYSCKGFSAPSTSRHKQGPVRQSSIMAKCPVFCDYCPTGFSLMFGTRDTVSIAEPGHWGSVFMRKGLSSAKRLWLYDSGHWPWNARIMVAALLCLFRCHLENQFLNLTIGISGYWCHVPRPYSW